ncbi:MAG: ACT domain-containing protein [Sedimentisphaerales bacterium]|nr:ACT domain-containing protein [Sedimentisphaerales bacterium]
MHVDIQFSIFLINKPGVLAQVLNELAREKINIIAMTMMDSVEHGVLRVVTTRAGRTREILEKLNASVNESEVLCINMPNQAGALADICSRLAEAHININYAYCTAGARGGRTTGVLRVADIKKATKVLAKSYGVKGAEKKDPKVRPSHARRGR